MILPVHNEGLRLRETLEAISETVSVRYEVIVVNDASSDSCCDFLLATPPPYENLRLLNLRQRSGVAHARNLGAEQAQAPVLVAMDAHCIPRASWLDRLLDELCKPGVGIVAPQIYSAEFPDAKTFGLTISDSELGVRWLPLRGDRPYEVPLAGCACMAMTQNFFQTAGQFEPMRSYGMEDVELCIRCWLLGYCVMMVPGAEVAHWFKKDPFNVGWHDFLYNRLRTAVLHFDGERLERILAALGAKPKFTEAVSSLLVSDIWTRYSQLREHRKRDADWLCRKFAIAL